MANLPPQNRAYLGKIGKERIPNSYEEACRSKVWVEAMKEEMRSMKENHTWDMMRLPKGKKPVGCRWVFTIKYKSSGEIERYKARLVAKGYTQVYGEDYTETFAPVAKLHSVRILLSIAVNLSWDLWQMDVKNAFLQGELEEEVYMASPPGYGHEAGKVCRLRKAIYGLKQSPRAWYHKLTTCLSKKGFKMSEADHTLFTHKGPTGIVAVLIYVDDLIITGDDIEGVTSLKKNLKESFDIKDLGELKYFLGIEMTRFEDGLFISQRKYVLDLPTETGKLGSRPAKTPIEEGYQDHGEGELFEDVKQYQRLVGKLIYLTITRPDLCFAVNQVSQHMKSPTVYHWNMVERILRYPKGNPGKGVWMEKRNDTSIIGYCDADYAGDKKDRKSTTGFCTFVGGNLVTWRSKKQKVVSLSSAESEYRAMRDVTKELVWIKYLLRDLGVQGKEPITLYCDNQAALHIASNPVFHERTKHVEIDCHFVREKIQDGTISTRFVRSEDQVADIFTKATTSLVGDYIQNKIGLLDLHQPVLRGSVEPSDVMRISLLDQGEERLSTAGMAAGMSTARMSTAGMAARMSTARMSTAAMAARMSTARMSTAGMAASMSTARMSTAGLNMAGFAEKLTLKEWREVFLAKFPQLSSGASGKIISRYDLESDICD
ncbi:Retrovirus-related Pol polyprotein from transposon RE2 [Cardamine amara subsp. amara]|uniref:Retrovirus-related Pol polyprotein from transposon RE2 n=1 Tax=Cardamine amara subsp. amara TaxID=228776 RepID=A0ABD1AG10_CARAN